MQENGVPTRKHIDALRESLETSGFITLDAEPWGRRHLDVSQIGLSYTPPTNIHFSDNHEKNNSYQTLEGVVKEYQTRCHCYQIAGQFCSERTRREDFDYGTTKIIASEEIEDTLLQALDSWGVPQEALVTSFSMAFERKILLNRFPRLARRQQADIQLVATALSGRVYPGMRDTLIALGFRYDKKAVGGSHSKRHSAGNDAVRAAAVLLSLLALKVPEPFIPVLTIGHTPKNKGRHSSVKHPSHVDRKCWHNSRPEPREFYPFGARLHFVKSGTTLGPESLPSPERLLERFADFNPVATGVSGLEIGSGWVCLRSRAELEDFVARVNGTKEQMLGDSPAAADLIWNVYSDYNPRMRVTPILQGLAETKREAQQHYQEARQRERLEWRNEVSASTEEAEGVEWMFRDLDVS